MKLMKHDDAGSAYLTNLGLQFLPLPFSPSKLHDPQFHLCCKLLQVMPSLPGCLLLIQQDSSVTSSRKPHAHDFQSGPLMFIGTRTQGPLCLPLSLDCIPDSTVYVVSPLVVAPTITHGLE